MLPMAWGVMGAQAAAAAHLGAAPSLYPGLPLPQSSMAMMPSGPLIPGGAVPGAMVPGAGQPLPHMGASGAPSLGQMQHLQS